MTNSSQPVFLYKELSREIIGIAFAVHNQLGPGFSEEIYEKAFILELEERGILFESQKVIEVHYKGKLLGGYRLDLVVDGKIILELKATTQMNELYKCQLISYLKATGLAVGYVINFGGVSVQQTRLINTKSDFLKI